MRSFFKFRFRFFPFLIFIVLLTAAPLGYAQQQQPVVVADEVVVTRSEERRVGKECRL